MIKKVKAISAIINRRVIYFYIETTNINPIYGWKQQKLYLFIVNYYIVNRNTSSIFINIIIISLFIQ